MKKICLLIASSSILLCLSNTLFAQPYSPTANKYLGVTSGIVLDMKVDANYVYVGGSFTAVAYQTGNGAKLTTTTVKPNLEFPKTGTSGSQITICVPDGAGGWYIGGTFTTVGTETRNRLARINADGSVHAWNPNASGIVRTIVVSGSDVYVGGDFNGVNSINGTLTRNRLAKLNNTDGTADATWDPNAGGSVYAIAISGSDIYVGGSFTTINGTTTRNRLAKLNNTDGTADATWNPNASGSVYAIAISGSYIYVGGAFSGANSINGTLTRNYLAKLNNTDGTAAAWNPNALGNVNSIAISGSDIYVGGAFNGSNSINGTLTRNRLAKLNNTDGTADATWDPNASGTINVITINGSDIYVGGQFTTINGVTARSRIARLNNTDGIADANWDPSANSTVLTIAINGSDMYVGGTFMQMNRTTRNNIARFSKTTGEFDPNWNPNADNTVYSVVINGTDIYLGGVFVNIGGQARNKLAKVNNTDGSVDATWTPNANDHVFYMVTDGSNLYVAGTFTAVGGQSREALAKLNFTNGNADATWNPNPAGSRDVYGIAIDGSDIYVSGYFGTIGGQTRNRIAKLNNTNGNADATWNPNANGSYTRRLAVDASGVYAVGDFDTVGGQPRNRIARLNKTNGDADSWNPNANSTCSAIALYGSDVYVGGGFSTIGGQSRKSIAKLNNIDGLADLTWNPNASTTVFSILLDGGDIYVGGGFTTMGGASQPYFALFTDRTLPVKLSLFSANVNQRNVTLNWSTASETNNSGFGVQRLTSDGSWKEVAFVKGHGTTSMPVNYSYEDKNLTTGTYSYRLKQVDYNGNYEYFNLNSSIEIGTPQKYSISQNYPNPFNPTTKIYFDVPIASSVKISVYDVSGREVKVLVNEKYRPGNYETVFDGSMFSSGVYFYKMVSGTFSETKKMILLK